MKNPKSEEISQFKNLRNMSKLNEIATMVVFGIISLFVNIWLSLKSV